MPKIGKQKKMGKKRVNIATRTLVKVPMVKKIVKAVEKKKGFFQTVGGHVGRFFGGATGDRIGSAAGKWISKVTGLGSYHIKQNSLMSSPPCFGHEDVIFTHREYVEDITGSVLFTNRTYSVQPGLPALFPWLSTQMGGYEQYKLEGMLIEFKSMSADALNSTNTALGTVIMATNYDSLDDAFVSKQQMESYEFSTSTKPSISSIHPIECSPRKNTLSELYVRQGPTTGDLRFCDVGTFNLATQGMQAAAVIGELWVTYKVRAIRKKLPTPLGDGLLSFKTQMTVGTGNAWPTVCVPLSGSNFTPTFGDSGTTNTCVIPYTGRFLIVTQYSASTSYTAGGQIAAFGSNAVLQAAWENSTGVKISGFLAGNATTTACAVSVVDVTGPASGFQVLYPTIVGGCFGTMFITQIPSNLSMTPDVLAKKFGMISQNKSSLVESKESSITDSEEFEEITQQLYPCAKLGMQKVPLEHFPSYQYWDTSMKELVIKMSTAQSLVDAKPRDVYAYYETHDYFVSLASAAAAAA